VDAGVCAGPKVEVVVTAEEVRDIPKV